MDYDEKKAMAEMTKAVDTSVDSHPSEDEWLLPKARAWKEEVEKKMAAAKEEAEEIKDVVKVCKFCECTPCLLDKVYDEMMFVAEGYEDSGFTNKEMRFEMYSFVAKKLWGRLGRGVRKALPHCILSEIHDTFPEKKSSEYVGFKESMTEE